VWIGQHAVILPSCHNIGNGAVIGAGSIVTKDVEPYAIVVGNPARTLRKRFSDDIIEKLEATQWWNMELDELQQHTEYLQQLVHAI
jgi:acetyltransferase-like isoleucine patch superfamily enzyme